MGQKGCSEILAWTLSEKYKDFKKVFGKMQRFQNFTSGPY